MVLLYAAMSRRLLFLAVFAGCCPDAAPKTASIPKPPEVRDLATAGEPHLKNLHELTFGANNAEAYWSFAGDRLIFQTDRKPYGCDQIMMMPSTGGTPKQISSGKGRTTCSFFEKGDQSIIYASTEAASPACPKPPDMSKGYFWGLFEYDIYKANPDGSNPVRLTDTPGYDAEGVVCPVDGSILFTSMRSGDLELWRMDADGKNPRQLTNTPGYDGGGVWSPDCKKIAWRASRPQGKDLDTYKELLKQGLVEPLHMDLWVANADGTEAHQITYLPGASFGPAFFPNGQRLIFASNYKQPTGPEFELYAIELDGSHLERITDSPSFDGFPMFSPDGTKLAFSSNRRDVVHTDHGDVYRLTGTPAAPHDTNVFVADWVDHVPDVHYEPETAAVDRYHDDIYYLADDAREGRGIGTKGLADAQDYVEKAFQAAGAETSRQPFEITTAIKRGDATGAWLDGKPVAADQLAPMPFSGSSTVSAPIVRAGWGISDADAKLDDYKHLSVKGKIVLVHRFVPPGAKLDATTSAKLGDIRRKAFVARTKGAVGLIVVDDGDPKQEEAQLPTLAPEDEIGVSGNAGIPVVVLTRKAAAALAHGGHAAKLVVALEPVRTPTANVIGVIRAGASAKLPGVLVIGAHLDHLGMGGGSNALDPKVHAVHNGADDNASGVAALLEVARTLGAHKEALARDVYVVAFSGEEEGDLGSDYYVKHLPTAQPIVAMLNMDMVGRMRNDELTVNGGGSATEWHELVQPACDAARVRCTIGGSGYGPSDHMAFYVQNIPVLFFFTGSHLDYHTATDDADKINSAGGVQVAKIVAQVAEAVDARPGALTYVKAPPEVMGGDVRRVGASLGTIPSYSDDPNLPPGLILSGVVTGGPAEKAGLRQNDRITAVGAVEIRNIEDLMFVLQAAKPGTQTTIKFVRDGKTQTTTATFGEPRGRR